MVQEAKEPLIIDFHTHTFPDGIAARAVDTLSHNSGTRPFSDGTTEGLLWNMKEAGILHSVILPVATVERQVVKVNDASAKLNEDYAGAGLCSFGCMHPDFEDYRKELARFEQLGLKGVKLHPVYQNAALDDIRSLRIIDRAAELGLIVITHAGFDVGFPEVDLCSPRIIRRVIDKIGDFPFVLAHMGGWMEWEDVPDCLADTGVYLDTAFSTGRMFPRDDTDGLKFPEEMLDTDGFMRLVEAFGADRILFGTDSPWADPKRELEFIYELPISDKERADILGRNAQRLLDGER